MVTTPDRNPYQAPCAKMFFCHYHPYLQDPIMCCSNYFFSPVITSPGEKMKEIHVQIMYSVYKRKIIYPLSFLFFSIYSGVDGEETIWLKEWQTDVRTKGFIETASLLYKTVRPLSQIYQIIWTNASTWILNPLGHSKIRLNQITRFKQILVGTYSAPRGYHSIWAKT